MHRFLSILMGVILLAAVVVVVLPWVLLVATQPFPGKTIFSVLFALIVLEKTWAMLVRMRRFTTRVKNDWTAVSVGLSYTAVMYTTLIEYYLRRPGLPNALCAAGGAVFILGAGLRYWASHHLGRQWTVHLDDNLGERKLISDGPYGLVRHPLYVAACFEAVGIPMLFNAPVAFVLAAAVFVPLELQRALFEERFLQRDFGAAYAEYAARVPRFVPRLRRRH